MIGSRAARLDRLVTLYMAHPLGRRARRAAILMYHSIADASLPARHPYYETRTSLPVFARQLADLATRGFRVLPLAELAEALRAGSSIEKAVALTFDDGYEDFATEGLPLLQRHGFPATAFLPTAFIGTESRRFNGRRCLTWSRVRALHAAGVEIGSHGVSHVQLAGLPPSRIREELRRSRSAIEEALSAPVLGFSYPYAFPEPDRDFHARFRDALVEAGYRYGVTTILGTVGAGADPLLLRRLPVNDADDPPFYRAKLAGAYDWLHAPQFAAKMAKALLT